MKKTLVTFLSMCVFILLLSSCSSKISRSEITNRDSLFDLGWKFMRDSVPGAETVTFNDSSWRNVDLPHDWSIEDLTVTDSVGDIGPFYKSSEGGVATGHVKGGTAWYRKHFLVEAADSGKHFTLRFDGVYMISTVWVNGQKVGSHYYGYTPFSFDITSLLKPGADNLIAVEVKNPGKNSRWYSGSGIYRHVWLTVTDKLRVENNGVYIATSVLSKDTAIVKLAISVKNDRGKPADAILKTRITDKNGNELASKEEQMKIEAGGTQTLTQSVSISEPRLWSPVSPELYTATIQIMENNSMIDSYTVPFGIRTLSFSVTEGFKLNGTTLELKGGCMHHDNGLLGSATFDGAEERRVRIMKENGFNAIRTSHNPPSKQFLDACDRLGMLVIDEAFDMWEHPKNPQDYSNYFKASWKSDLESMILRDRNHPSVIIWSIGNEIYERADTSGVRIAKQLAGCVKELDNTRPVTAAVCFFWDHPGRDWSASAPAFASLDVSGYNYQWREYENDHTKFPERIMMGTESFPSEAFENWQQVEKNAWVIGDFVWTGMDYLGESGIGHMYYDKKDAQFSMPWPWYNAWCGDIDICGGKKPQSYFRDVVWNNSKLEMAVHAPIPAGKTEGVSLWGWPDEYQSWTWPGNEGKTLQVAVYSRCQQVRLELNGKVIGTKPVSTDTKLTAKFDVPYASGELKAIGITDGKEVATKIFKTTGKPAAIKVTADKTLLKADRNDLAYVTIEITDAAGNWIPNSEAQVSISVSGDAELIASGNAAPNDMKSFRKPVCRVFQGRCLAIVRPFAKPGSAVLKVSGQGLPDASIDLIIK